MTAPRPSRIALPDAPSLVAGHGRAAILTVDGELLACVADEAAATLKVMDSPVLVHAPAQSVWPEGQTQLPLLHEAPTSQA